MWRLTTKLNRIIRDVSTSQTTNTAATTSVTTTSPQTSRPTATVPTATMSLPSTFGVSASDLLGEQMELRCEIANLRLLLLADGA